MLIFALIYIDMDWTLSVSASASCLAKENCANAGQPWFKMDWWDKSEMGKMQNQASVEILQLK